MRSHVVGASGRCILTRSSIFSRPRSSRSRIAAAVNCFVIDATLNRALGLLGTFHSTFARPWPLLTITSLPRGDEHRTGEGSIAERGLHDLIHPSDVLREADSGPTEPRQQHEGEPVPVDARLHRTPLCAVGIRDDPLEHHHNLERPLGSAAFVRDGERLSVGGHRVPSGPEHLTVHL